ncbi:hypothetical protein CI102_9350 [Trichoderma harzianum]|nr:hypothetical protein CI102_9350 [Trichoderma harzianum]
MPFLFYVDDQYLCTKVVFTNGSSIKILRIHIWQTRQRTAFNIARLIRKVLTRHEQKTVYVQILVTSNRHIISLQ